MRRFIHRLAFILFSFSLLINEPVFAVSDQTVNCSISGSIRIANNHLEDSNSCTGEIEIPDGVTTILSEALAFSAIDTITIPGTVTTIGGLIFNNYSQAPHIKFLGNAPSNVDNNAFKAWNGSVNAPIPGISATVGIDATGYSRPYWYDLPINFQGTTTKSYLYYANSPSSFLDIGRAATDRSDQINSFWAGTSSGYFDGGVTVRGDYIFWTISNSIVRARVDGSGNQEVIYTSDISGTYLSGITTFGEYLYWSDLHRKSIGRSLLDGSSPNPDFLPNTSRTSTQNDIYGIFVNSQHIYWANYESHSIGRANLDGSDINNSFIILSGTPGPCSIWVNESRIFWTSYNVGAIGSSDLEGLNVNPNYITTNTPNDGPYYLVADSEYIYWTNYVSSKISRAKLNGSDIEHSFLDVTNPIGIWIVQATMESESDRGSSGSDGAASKSQEQIEADQEKARQRAIDDIRSTLVAGKPLNLQQLLNAGFFRLNEKSVNEINNEIKQISLERKVNLEELIFLIDKYVTLDIILNKGRFYFQDLVRVGLTSSDTLHRAQIIRELKKMNPEELSSFEKIQSSIKNILSKIAIRKTRIVEIIERTKARRL